MSKETYSPWDSAELLDNDEMVIEYLKAALEENDPEFFVNPHFSPGGVTIAEDFRLQRVLATASVVVTTFVGACARWGRKDPRARAQRSLFLAMFVKTCPNAHR